MNIKIYNLKTHNTKKGNVLNFLKKNEKGFSGFGEVYFSQINPKSIKAWRKHKRMKMNLAVIVGEVKFVFFNSVSKKFKVIKISEEIPKRICVGPNIWFGFQNLSKKKSIIVNFSSIKHNEKEIERKKLKLINFKWHS